jgi:hypothetical protein
MIFFLEHAGELRIIILRRKKEGKAPGTSGFTCFDREEKTGKNSPTHPLAHLTN